MDFGAPRPFMATLAPSVRLGILNNELYIGKISLSNRPAKLYQRSQPQGNGNGARLNPRKRIGFFERSLASSISIVTPARSGGIGPKSTITPGENPSSRIVQGPGKLRSELAPFGLVICSKTVYSNAVSASGRLSEYEWRQSVIWLLATAIMTRAACSNKLNHPIGMKVESKVSKVDYAI